MNSSAANYSNALWVNEARTFRHPAGILNDAKDHAFLAPAFELTLDASGIVQRCDAAAAEFFFASPEALIGQHITELIPELPLKSATPAYNVAYATFCAARPVWLWFKGVDSTGCSIRLYVSFAAPKSGGRKRQIVLRLRDSMEGIGLRGVALNGSSPHLDPAQIT